MAEKNNGKEKEPSFSRKGGKGEDFIELLLVDDEVDFVNIIAKRLSKRNIAVTGALSGTEAIQILRKKDFDLCVLDLKMEDMNGIEVLKFFKKMVPDMPVIMLTGHGSAESAGEGMAFGAYDYLTKPYELAKLMKKIEEAMGRG